MTPPRRVLVLAYFFPPLGGAGVQRTLKFVKYLPEHGYRPTVITTRSRRYGILDETLAAEIPAGVRVLRVADIPLPTWAAGVLRRLGLHRAASVLSWPDISLGWAVAATISALREIRRNRPDVILTTSPPVSAHLAGWWLRRLTGVPWVADFRDEWATNLGAAVEPAPRRTLTRWVEPRLAAAAASVVVVADYFRIAGAPRRLTVPNGVDESDVPAAAPEAPDGEVFRIAHVGSVYADRDCRPVLDALGRLAADGRIERDRVELRVVGTVWIEDLAQRSPVPLVQTAYVDHPRAIAEMRGASTLLLYVAPGSLAPSGKLFEYLACERPILSVAHPDNLAHRLVEEWGAGRSADPDDPEAIDAAILDLYERWREGRLGPVVGARERVLERYSRRRLTGELARVLDDAAC